MDTTENNKLIAEFMGYENVSGVNRHPEYKIPSQSYELPDFDNRIMETIDIFSPYFDDMKFHSDWDWLMPVVEKIESLGFKINSFGKNENDGSYYTIIYNSTEGIIALVNEINLSRFEAIYNAVIEFIKWYNNQQNNYGK